MTDTGATGGGARARRLARPSRASTFALVGGLIASPVALRAQPACVGRDSALAARSWPAPLDRVVAIRLRDVPLRAALDRLAVEGRLRFSYSADLLPVERPVCLWTERARVGDALSALLAGTGMTPVVVGGDQVVLAQARAEGPRPAADGQPARARGAEVLERVVVTGTSAGAPQRASPFALDVVDAGTLERAGGSSLAAGLDGTVPGLWLWTQSPTSVLARYGSVRGASSFGVSAPKIYVDGIEVANPLLFTTFDPTRVERVEVIRGPQGAALYGADAISGVINIVTRHEGVGPGATRAELRGSAGTAQSDFASGGVLVQDHALALRMGTGARSATVGVSVSTVGAVVPGASTRQVLATGSARRIGARSVVSGTARFSATDAAAPVSPLLGGLLLTPTTGAQWSGQRAADPDSLRRTFVGDDGSAQRVRQYTLGGTFRFQPTARWTHVATAGIDGYRLTGVSADGVPIPSATDSALRAARGRADRGTLRLASTARFGSAETRALTIIVGAEHSAARERTLAATTLVLPAAGSRGAGGRGGGMPAFGTLTAPVAEAAWWSNTGVLAQAQAAVRNTLFLSAGGRLERVAGPSTETQVAALPMLGAAYVTDAGPLTLKLRTAYGRGIRPPRTVTRGATWTGRGSRESLVALEPEAQSGVEAGGDVLWGSRFALHVTRFDQRAAGLIQPVLIAMDSTAGNVGGGPPTNRPPGGRRVAYQLQNLGAITNRGWEFQATTGAGPLAVAATVSLVGSRVERLASGYRGDLLPGDRMLEVPARTMSLTAGWTARRWSASWTVLRASDWVNYDRLALAEALSEGDVEPRDLAGSALRSYWRRYDGVTRLRATGALHLWRRASLTVTGDNLLDRQLGEPDDLTVLPGRSVSVGLRTSF